MLVDVPGTQAHVRCTKEMVEVQANKPTESRDGLVAPKAKGKKMWTILGIVACVGILLFLYARFVESKWLRIASVRIGADAPVRFVQISDIHYTGDRKYLQSVVRRVNELEPEFICITGDIVESREMLEGALAILSGLSAPVFSVPGNWEYLSNISFDPVKEFCAATGGRFLLNESANFGSDVTIVGLDYHVSGRADLEKAFAEANDRRVLLLVHGPAAINRLGDRKVALAIAGHSHGGQLRLPLIGATVLPDQVGRYVRGLYQTPNGPLYVNVGVGTTIIHARFLCRPEITVFEF